MRSSVLTDRADKEGKRNVWQTVCAAVGNKSADRKCVHTYHTWYALCCYLPGPVFVGLVDGISQRIGKYLQG